MSYRLWEKLIAFLKSRRGCQNGRSGCTLHQCARMMEYIETEIQRMLQSPNRWPRLNLSLVGVGRNFSLISPKVQSGLGLTSQISSMIHPYSHSYLTLSLRSFIFPKCTRYLNSQRCVSILSAAVCSLILHLGKASVSNAAWAGKALCIPRTWNFLFGPHPGYTFIEDYVTLAWTMLLIGNLFLPPVLG